MGYVKNVNTKEVSTVCITDSRCVTQGSSYILCTNEYLVSG